MRSRLLHLRLWLEEKGLFPKGKLAFITWYFFGLDVLLFLLQKLASLLHKPFGKYLGAWIVFLSLVVIVLFCVIAARRLSSKLLWRLRNRLIVTYIFIGVIPLVLLVALAVRTIELFAGQFATFVVTSKLQTELRDLDARNQVLARSIAAEINGGQKPETIPPIAAAGNELRTSVWLNRQLLINNSKQDPPTPVPASVLQDFACVVRDGGKFFLRAVTDAPSRQGMVAVVSSRPFDSRTLLALASDLGEVTFFEARVPMFSVGSVPEPRRMLDGVVGLPADLLVTNWPDGHPINGAAISVQTRYSKLYGYLFPVALGELASTIALMLILLAIVLAIFEFAALYIGTRLTHSVTGAVGQIYLATTHVNRGDFSHRIPITSNDQLAALATSFNLMTESLEKLLREQKEKQRLENEITIAQEVQAQLFPRQIAQLPSLEVHGFCRPARSVSGDYYDFLPLGTERMVLAVGDVSGKGISAALLMATIHSAVRAYSMEGIPAFRQAQAVGAGPVLASKYDSLPPGAEASPGMLLSLLNHQLYHSTPMEKYATLFVATYDGAQRRLTFSNAGHLPPMVLGETGSIRRLEDGGTVVGLFDDISYDEGSVQLHRGDIFLAYSDGVTEPENDFGEFGEQRLVELVQENRDLPLDRITEIVTGAVDDWIGAAEQPDDVTLVLARAR
jgi:sigma-B regulation protein RsbU (phosphoserine phosphatase)